MNSEMEKKLALEQNQMAQQRTDMAHQRTDMAQNRTDLAFERTMLTNSQSLLAYVRTALAMFAAGVGMFEFIDNPAIVHIGIVMMSVSPLILLIGLIHFFKVRKKIKSSHYY